jgi:c-di-GMP-binding flagellar brake protein YcgR
MGLFNRFIDRFSHSANDFSGEPTINHDWIKSFEKYHYLTHLQDKRQLLEVFVKGEKGSFQSMIVGIDFFAGSFSLDAFSPQMLVPESLVGYTVIIRHQSQWQQLDIEATVVQCSEKNSCYHLLLPIVTDYHPRRHHTRFQLNNDKYLKSDINPLYGAPWYATVKDISEGGMRVAIPGNIRPHLQKDNVLPKCQVMLDDNTVIQCRGIVRAYTYYSKPYRHTEISIAYHNMSQAHQTDLRRFLSYVSDIAA